MDGCGGITINAVTKDLKDATNMSLFILSLIQLATALGSDMKCMTDSCRPWRVTVEGT